MGLSLPKSNLIFLKKCLDKWVHFNLSYLMTGGGPGKSTVTLVMSIYNAAFKQHRMGYACAQAMFLLIVVVVINAIEDKVFKEER